MFTAHGVRAAPLDTESHLKVARWLARIMDARWRVGPLRFGMEPFLNLVPGVGDAGSLAVSLYQLVLAARLALPGGKLTRMIVNIGLDFLFALIPVAGDVADMVFKVHVRNQRILEDHIARSQSTLRTPAALNRTGF